MSEQLLKEVVQRERDLALAGGYELWGDRVWIVHEAGGSSDPDNLWVATLKKTGGYITILADREHALVTEDNSLPPEDGGKRPGVFLHIGAVLEDLSVLWAPVVQNMAGMPSSPNADGIDTIGIGRQPFHIGRIGERRVYTAGSDKPEIRSGESDCTPVSFMIAPGDGRDYTYGVKLTLGGVPLRIAEILEDYRIPRP